MPASPIKKPIPMLSRALAKHYSNGIITEVEDLTPHLRRISLTSSNMRQRDVAPGQYVRVQINDPLSVYGILRPGDTLRTYTISDYEAETGRIDIQIHLYEGEGIGLNWARQAKVGQSVIFWGPQGDFLLKPADYYLFVGEETATLGFAPMIAALGCEAKVCAVLESDSSESELYVPSTHPIVRVHRHGRSPIASTVLLDALAQLELPDGAGIAYIAGEARTCQQARKYLMHERGWSLSSILVKPFWAKGKRGLH